MRFFPLKKILGIALLIIVLAFLAACGEQEEVSVQEEPVPTAEPTASPVPVREVSIHQQDFFSTDTVLDFSYDESVTPETLAEIADNLKIFTDLQTVDFTGCTGITDEDVFSFAEKLPENVDIVWDFNLYGLDINTTYEEIDFSNIKITDDAAALEACMPAMHRLNRVVMCECGIDDETMDALNKRYENTRFVWTVHFGRYQMRTDETAFIAARWPDAGYLFDKDVGPLQYCTDLIALDFGHHRFTDISWLYNMPNLQYLILAEGAVNDITPVASLHDLIYLELFLTQITDLSPLLECKNLQDLNICYIPLSAAESAYEVLPQMTWLHRLWYCGSGLNQTQRNELRAALPDTQVELADGLESTGLDWRYNENYYNMRDILDYYYMPGGTNGGDDD